MDNHQDLKQKNTRTALTVFGIVFGMVGLAFASVPLYDIFCRVTGWGGTTQVSAVFPEENEIIERKVTVRFDANTVRELDWDFGPEYLSTPVNLGERGFINYYAENKADIPLGGTAVFNVTPLKAGKYFHKVQCFCFDEQILQPGQRVNMPVLFYVDPALNDDPNLQDVTTITLSYSFFKSDSDALDDALEDFYNTAEVAQ